MSVKDEYWYRGAWPSETAEHVPLAAAVMMIGPAVAGSDWTGDEGRDSGNFSWRRGIERARARTKAARLGIRSDPKPVSADTAADWLEASRRPAPEPYVPGHFRLRAAQSELVRAAIWGEIDTFYRAHGDTTMKPIPADAWAAMAFDVVFEACHTDPDNYRTRDGSCPIFVERRSLERWFATIASGEKTQLPPAESQIERHPVLTVSGEPPVPETGEAAKKTPQYAHVVFAQWAAENGVDRSSGSLEGIRKRYLREKRRTITTKTIKKALEAVKRGQKNS